MASFERLLSPFEILWAEYSESIDTDQLYALRSKLLNRLEKALTSTKRNSIASAIAEIDGALVSRLAKEASQSAPSIVPAGTTRL